MSQKTEDLLNEREKTHGSYINTARIIQELKIVLQSELRERGRRGQRALSNVQRESLDMIVHKIGRIISGNPDEADHWNDIAGYAKLVPMFDAPYTLGAPTPPYTKDNLFQDKTDKYDDRVAPVSSADIIPGWNLLMPGMVYDFDEFPVKVHFRSADKSVNFDEEPRIFRSIEQAANDSANGPFGFYWREFSAKNPDIG